MKRTGKKMNEKLQYAEMLDIPVSTCSITYKPNKKRKPPEKKKSVNGEAVKTKLINKINEESETVLDESPVETCEGEKKEGFLKRLKSGKVKVSVVGVQLFAIGILVATIFLTNAFMPNSGLNVFFKNAFGTEQASTDDTDNRVYSDFSPVIPVANSENLKIEDGVMDITAAGSVYSPCDGTVSSLTYNEETKKYDLEITHCDNFKTILSGIDYAYTEVGGAVFSNIPVGYVKESAKMCFYGEDGSVITGYTLQDNSVVWAV